MRGTSEGVDRWAAGTAAAGEGRCHDGNNKETAGGIGACGVAMPVEFGRRLHGMPGAFYTGRPTCTDMRWIKTTREV